MANYALSINSTFQPFTYQELVAPIAHQQQVMDALSEQYDKLSAQADVLEAMGNDDRDKNSGVYDRYKAYSDSLRKEADNLYRFGLNSESRRRLSELRRRYNTDIVPIQNAWNKREEEAALQTKAEMEAAARGIDLRFSRRAADTNLQSYINNPNQTFRTITGQQITSEIANQFKGLASQIQQDKSGNYWIGRKQISPIEYAIITQNGMDYNQFADFINNPNDPKYSTIKGIIDNNLAAHSIGDFDLKTQADMFRYGAMGVSAGVGGRSMQLHTDPYASKMLDMSNEMQMYNYKKSVDAAYAAADAAAAAANGAGGTMIDSIYQLPMGQADYSNFEEQRDAMKDIGYASGKDGRLMYTGKVKAGDKNYSLYDKSGKIISREQFVKQGANEKEKQELQRYYSKVEEAGTVLGLESGYTHKDITNRYNALRKGDLAQMANVRSLNYEKSDWNPTSKNYPVTEITGYSKGRPVFDTKQTTLNDLLNKKDSNKNDINVAAYWSSLNGQEGLILATTEDGKAHRYFISANNMPESNIKDARQYFSLAEIFRQRANNARTKEESEAEYAKAREALKIAYDDLHIGLTIHNSPYDQKIVRQATLKQQGLGE